MDQYNYFCEMPALSRKTLFRDGFILTDKSVFPDGSETSDTKRIMPQQENGRNKGHGFSSAIIIALDTV